MPDRKALRIGDKIRLLHVPQGDLDQRDREIREGREAAGWTADTIERIIRNDPVVTIARIDEYGQPWFDYELQGADGREEHTLAIMEDESWEMA